MSNLGSPVGLRTQVFDTDQITSLEGERYQAQLWYRKHGNQGAFTPHPETAEFRNGDAAGFFLGNELALPGIYPNEWIEARLRVWDTQTGDSWETATSRFESNIVEAITSSATGFPSYLTNLEFTSLQIHPEGNVFAFTWPDQQLCEHTYQLERAEDIAGPWTAVEEPAELINGRWQVTMESQESATLYFRLRRL